MKRLLFVIVMCTIIFNFSNVFADDSENLKKRLEYLNDIPEISWYEVERNNVYIGFNNIPIDFRVIVNAAAVHGNNAYGFGVHVWAVIASQKGWRPGDGPYYCCATARGGRIKKSDCR